MDPKIMKDGAKQKAHALATSIKDYQLMVGKKESTKNHEALYDVVMNMNSEEDNLSYLNAIELAVKRTRPEDSGDGDL